jgi:TolB protein
MIVEIAVSGRKMIVKCVRVVLALMVLSLPGWAQATGIVIRKGPDQRVLAAVPPFATDAGHEALGAEMAKVIAYDLDFSGLFRILPPERYPATFHGLTNDPKTIDFEAWRTSQALYLVYGYVSAQGGQVVVQCFLFDVGAGNYVVGKKLTSDEQWWRLIAHQFSDEIVKYIDGVPGIATSRICFTGGEPGKKEIFIADYDGANVAQVTKHGSISVLPVFSPDGTKIAYVSYKDRYQFIYALDLASGKSTPLSKRVGMNSSPAWAPDGRRLAIVLSKDANSEIYLVNADGGGERRLTNNPAVDTSPTFSPDGSQIAFISDRGGRPQLWVMDAGGGNQRRLSTMPGKYFDPVWSPDGKSIAYVVEGADGFEINVMNADGSSPRQVTASSGSNEGPSWSADSRHVVFSSTRTGRAALWTVTLTTGDQRPIEGVSVRAQSSDWGPRRD